MTELEKRIRTYAFNHNTGLDESTYRVMSEVVRSTNNSNAEGLYDRLFGEDKKDGNNTKK
jgi:hypothetical protein